MRLQVAVEAHAVSHHHERVEPQGSRHDPLATEGPQGGGQPAAFAAVREQKHDVVVLRVANTRPQVQASSKRAWHQRATESGMRR